jgi:probable F420-dependent oxidoreductase
MPPPKDPEPARKALPVPAAPASPAPRTTDLDALADLQVVAPFWLDRPDNEVIEIAAEARRNGFGAIWLGEMATFDAFALATAVGLQTPGLALKIGPLAVGVRSPVALALGLVSVSSLTGAHVDLALGASSPDIVSGWHDRPWAAVAARARETVEAVRSILAGERAAYSGEHVRTHGFRLKQPQRDAKISLAAFGPSMTRVAAATADEIVLNLVTPERIAQVRAIVDAEARSHGHPPPEIAVWVTVALDPGIPTLEQMAAQIAVYLRPPGYGEMFTELGFGSLVERARAGVKRSELAQEITIELLREVCAVGSHSQIRARLASYRAAGATRIGIAPATAEDPAGHRVLAALGPRPSEVGAA